MHHPLIAGRMVMGGGSGKQTSGKELSESFYHELTPTIVGLIHSWTQSLHTLTTS